MAAPKAAKSTANRIEFLEAQVRHLTAENRRLEHQVATNNTKLASVVTLAKEFQTRLNRMFPPKSQFVVVGGAQDPAEHLIEDCDGAD